MSRRMIFTVACFVALQSAPAGPDEPAFRAVSSAVRFTLNRGQIADAEGRARPDIRFIAEAQGVRLYFMQDGISYVFTQSTARARGSETQDGPLDIAEAGRDSIIEYRLDLRFTGCNRNPRIRGADELAGYANYYYPQCPDGVLRVPSYDRIVYEDLWDNIDMIFSSKQGRVKYEFLVKPGGNVADIKLAYLGAASVVVNDAGGLEVTTPLGGIRDMAPESFQQGKIIGSRFRLDGSTVAIEVEPYDRGSTLTIDPWATYYGGTLRDNFYSVAVDGEGNSLFTGTTGSSNYPVYHAWQSSYAGGIYDAVVVKLTPTGALCWATYYGGSGDESSRSIAIGQNNESTSVGSTWSTDFPVSSNAFQSSRSGGMDGSIISLDSAGTRIWATYLGGSDASNGGEGFFGVVYDSNNRIYVTGTSVSSNYPVTTNAYQQTRSGVNDMIITCLSSPSATTVALQWSTYMGGSDADWGIGLACDGSKLMLHGITWSSNFPTTAGAFQPNSGGQDDAVIVAFSTSGTMQYSTHLGGGSHEWPHNICIDASGNYIVAGMTESTNFPVANAWQVNNGGVKDMYIAKFTSTNSLAWSTYYGGSGTDGSIWSNVTCAIGSSGEVYAACATSSTNFPVHQAIQASLSGSSDIGIVKFHSSGSREWATYYGGTSGDNPTQVAVDANGNIVLSGITSSTNIPLLTPVQSIYGGGQDDGFAMQLTSSGQMGGGPSAQIQTSTLSSSQFCPGASLQVPFTLTGTFNSGNIFTAELSAPNGSFAAPVSIGTLPGIQAGTVDCVIPPSTASGTAYRIRVRSSNPSVTGSDNGSNLTVHPRPVSTLSPADTVPLCPSGSVLLTATPGSGYAYKWLRDGNLISGATAVSYNASAAGAYKVVITNSTSCSDTSAATVLQSYPGDASYLVWTGATSNDWSTRGNWDQPCAIPGSGDTVRIAGAMPVPALTPTVSLSVLEMNNPGTLHVGGRLRITSSLLLFNGFIDAAREGIELDSGASIVGGSASSHIITSDTGTVSRAGIGSGASIGAVLFPVGPEPASYSPVLLANAGTQDAFSVRVEKGVKTNGTGGTLKTSHAVNRTWHVTENQAGGSDATLTVAWTSIDELPDFLRDRCMIARYGGTAWQNLQIPAAAAGSDPYTRSVSGISAFSPFGVGDSLAQLPVVITEMSAERIGTAIRVRWRTETETNNAGFRIERACADTGPWTPRGFVPGAGVCASDRHYGFTDQLDDAIEQDLRLFYRLVQVDADGSELYSAVIDIEPGAGLPSFAITDLRPNPARCEFRIGLEVSDAQDVGVYLYDGIGRVVRVLREHEMLGSGTHILGANVYGVPAGSYWLHARGMRRSAVRRIIVE